MEGGTPPGEMGGRMTAGTEGSLCFCTCELPAGFCERLPASGPLCYGTNGFGCHCVTTCNYSKNSLLKDKGLFKVNLLCVSPNYITIR